MRVGKEGGWEKRMVKWNRKEETIWGTNGIGNLSA